MLELKLIHVNKGARGPFHFQILVKPAPLLGIEYVTTST